MRTVYDIPLPNYVVQRFLTAQQFTRIAVDLINNRNGCLHSSEGVTHTNAPVFSSMG